MCKKRYSIGTKIYVESHLSYGVVKVIDYYSVPSDIWEGEKHYGYNVANINLRYFGGNELLNTIHSYHCSWVWGKIAEQLTL